MDGFKNLCINTFKKKIHTHTHTIIIIIIKWTKNTWFTNQIEKYESYVIVKALFLLYQHLD